MPDFRIHGDNIVECERTLNLIAQALGVPDQDLPTPTGSPLAPRFTLTLGNGEVFTFTFLPGFGRWDVNVLDVVRQRGGRLREAADAIVSRVVDGGEELLLAVEYCGALPAGNQAWQRSGRAFSFAHSGIPYIYIAELSGYELDSNRRRKAARMPNPAVPFSYELLTYSTDTTALPVFVRSPGASDDAVREHAPFYGEDELLEILRGALRAEPTRTSRDALEKKVTGLVEYLAGSRRKKDTLPADDWGRALEAVKGGGSLADYLAEATALPWTKTAYIAALTDTAREFMAVTASFARGLTSTSLPMCLVTEDRRAEYAGAIGRLYPAAPERFLEWCARSGHLAVCWVMGFKPRGDDARPDRGLPPLCRMLVGDGTDVLTVVYGPAPKAAWPALESSPAGLMQRNGLWESILVCSDAVLIDADTLTGEPPLAYLEEHWAAAVQATPPERFLVTPAPQRAGEHDVDTVLHLLFARFGRPAVFEGLCNPPGGDWSGLSLLTADRGLERRWLVLPRVTAPGSKRPDHVFQLFGPFEPFLVLAVESKEHARTVEEEIGPRLGQYVGELMASPPSVERAPGEPWRHFEGAGDATPPPIATAAAFVATSREELEVVAARSSVDVVFGAAFSASLDGCRVWSLPCSERGEAVCEFLASLALDGVDLAFELHS